MRGLRRIAVNHRENKKGGIGGACINRRRAQERWRLYRISRARRDIRIELAQTTLALRLLCRARLSARS